MRRNIRLTESQLHRVIKESVKKILSESKHNKLQNSFKSKEDMTRYRDMYSPYTEDYGPFSPYRHTLCDDGYDYCGDDNDKETKDEYNIALSKRLATKGGQMSYDWEQEMPLKGSDTLHHEYMDDMYKSRKNREDMLNNRRERIAGRLRKSYVYGKNTEDMKNEWNDYLDRYNQI